MTEERANEFRFSPPLYLQRYDFAHSCLIEFNCKSILDIGCAECKFLKILKNSNENINVLIGIDKDGECLLKAKNSLTDCLFDYVHSRSQPLELYLLQGDISEPDDYFIEQLNWENCKLDMITLIEVIEHMYEETLKKCIETVFCKIAPKFVLITTPNRDFNEVFKNSRSQLTTEIQPASTQQFRHPDHKFEFTRDEFSNWCQSEILNKFKNYSLVDKLTGVGSPPAGYENVGFCTQIAIFCRNDLKKDDTSSQKTRLQSYLIEKRRKNFQNYLNRKSNKTLSTGYFDDYFFHQTRYKKQSDIYKVIYFNSFPFEPYDFENNCYRDLFLINELKYLIKFSISNYSSNVFEAREIRHCDNPNAFEGDPELENFNLDDQCTKIILVDDLCEFRSIKKIGLSKKEMIEIMSVFNFQFTMNLKYLIYNFSNDCDIKKHLKFDCENCDYDLSSEFVDNDETIDHPVYMDEEEQFWDVDLQSEPQLPVLPHQQFEDALENKSFLEKAKYTPVSLENKTTSRDEANNDINTQNPSNRNDNDVILSRYTGYNYNSLHSISFENKIRINYRKKRKELKKQTAKENEHLLYAD